MQLGRLISRRNLGPIKKKGDKRETSWANQSQRGSREVENTDKRMLKRTKEKM